MVKSHRRYAVRKFVMFGMITFCLTLGGAALVSVFGNKVGHSVAVRHLGFSGCALPAITSDRTSADSNIPDNSGIFQDNFGIENPEDLIVRDAQ
jgi:hypothetical protein